MSLQATSVGPPDYLAIRVALALAHTDRETAQWASADSDDPAYCLRRALRRISASRRSNGEIVGPDAVLNAVVPWITRALASCQHGAPLPTRTEIEDALPRGVRFSLTDKGRALVTTTPIGVRRLCLWCDEEVTDTDQTIAVDGQLMHDGGLPGTRTGCAAEYRADIDASPIRLVVETPTGPRTFLEFVRRCGRCDRDFMVSREEIERARTEGGFRPQSPDSLVAAFIGSCLSCSTGRLHEAEYVTEG